MSNQGQLWAESLSLSSQYNKWQPGCCRGQRRDPLSLCNACMHSTIIHVHTYTFELYIHIRSIGFRRCEIQDLNTAHFRLENSRGSLQEPLSPDFPLTSLQQETAGCIDWPHFTEACLAAAPDFRPVAVRPEPAPVTSTGHPCSNSIVPAAWQRHTVSSPATTAFAKPTLAVRQQQKH